MCGIAGIVDLVDRRPVPPAILERMAGAIVHRGPDEDGYLYRPGVGLASRRLSIVGLADGRQPIFNEDRSVATVYNGELFDYPEIRADLESRGHRFVTHADTEIVPHLWEEHGDRFVDHLLGQFALAVWDERRQAVFLARDRFGICPLYWSRQGDWLLFASEIKALLASGWVQARPDLRGIDQVFNFFAVPGPTTCFAGVQLMLPGWCMNVPVGQGATPSPRPYWQIDFPDRGDEAPSVPVEKLCDEFEAHLYAAVERRLRADVPVVQYLSGGIDSSIVAAMATKALGRPIPTFTIQVPHAHLDETGPASLVSERLGSKPIVIRCDDRAVTTTYPRLVWAGEAPVVDTSAAGLLLLAECVHQHGYKVALTGEGSDEFLAGYSWFKFHEILRALDAVPGLPAGSWLRRWYLRQLGGPGTHEYQRRLHQAAGGMHGFHEVYQLMSLSRRRFYSASTLDALQDHLPYAELAPDLERLRRWHPFHRGLYWGIRIHLGGHLLSLKGDRIAMHSSVETRYPFLDERVFSFLAKLHPRWKLRGFWDKYLLRRLGERWLPREIAWRPKAMFMTPFDCFFSKDSTPLVDQLLSDESLRRTGYFDAAQVHYWMNRFRSIRRVSHLRTSVEMGLVAVVATQMWHHTFVDPSLADVPPFRPGAGPSSAVAGDEPRG